jgi:CubicO group peptidase (beta-lactamase class C family)
VPFFLYRSSLRLRRRLRTRPWNADLAIGGFSSYLQRSWPSLPPIRDKVAHHPKPQQSPGERQLRKPLVISAFLIFRAEPLPMKTTQIHTPDDKQVDALVREEMQKQHIPGLALGVYLDGNIVKAGATASQTSSGTRQYRKRRLPPPPGF